MQQSIDCIEIAEEIAERLQRDCRYGGRYGSSLRDRALCRNSTGNLVGRLPPGSFHCSETLITDVENNLRQQGGTSPQIRLHDRKNVNKRDKGPDKIRDNCGGEDTPSQTKGRERGRERESHNANNIPQRDSHRGVCSALQRCDSFAKRKLEMTSQDETAVSLMT